MCVCVRCGGLLLLSALHGSPVLRVQASFVGAVAVADLVKSTLGPKGMVRRVRRAALQAPAHADAPWFCRLACTRGGPLVPRHTPDTHPQDKILQSMSRGSEVTITNDGATILKSIYVDNPAAKVLVGEPSRAVLGGGGGGEEGVEGSAHERGGGPALLLCAVRQRYSRRWPALHDDYPASVACGRGAVAG